VAALLAPGPDYVADREAAEQLLISLIAGGGALRVPLGQDALWRAPTAVVKPAAQRDAAALA